MKTIRIAAVVAAFFVLGACPVLARDGGGYLVAQAQHDLMAQVASAMDSGDYDEAIRSIERAFQASPFDESIKSMAAKAYKARGWASYEKDDFDDGMVDFKRASAFQSKKDYETCLGLGYGSFRLRNYDDALYYLYDAAYVYPDDPSAHELIGTIYYQRGRLEDAIREWETAAELNPGNKELVQMLAKARKEFTVEGGFNSTETYYFTIKYEGEERRDLGDMVLDILDRAYRDIGGDLEYYPNEPVAVILYTKQQFSNITDAPAWSGGVFDGSIRIPVGGNVNREALEYVLYHEYAHAVVAMIAGTGGVPTWVNEGIAQYEERWVRERPAGMEKSKVVPLAKLEGPFVGMTDPAGAKAAYDESLSAVSFFIDRFGRYSLARLVRLLGEGRALSGAIHECTGISYKDFERYWLASLDD